MNKKLSFPFGAILLLVTTLFNVINLITTLVNPYVSYSGFTIFLMVVEILASVFLAVSMLIRNKMLITVSAGVATLIQLLVLLQSFISLFSGGTFLLVAVNLLAQLMWVLAMASILVLNLDLIPALKKLYFLPAALVLLSKLFTVLRPFLLVVIVGIPFLTAFGQAIGTVFGSILPVATFFLIGHWLVNPYAKGVVPAQPKPQGYRPVQQGYQQPYQGGYPQQGYQQPAQNAYPQQPQYQPQQPDPAALQELERYQQMLQSGVITQEEYNAARARILGL